MNQWLNNIDQQQPNSYKYNTQIPNPQHQNQYGGKTQHYTQIQSSSGMNKARKHKVFPSV